MSLLRSENRRYPVITVIGISENDTSPSFQPNEILHHVSPNRKKGNSGTGGVRNNSPGGEIDEECENSP
jgi:hypothetical protein